MPPAGVVLAEGGEVGREPAPVALVAEQPGDAVRHRFRDAAVAETDHRHTHALRLDEHDPEAFAVAGGRLHARHAEQPSADLLGRLPAKEAITPQLVLRQRLQRRTQRTIANDNQLGFTLSRGSFRHRADEVFAAFLLDQPSDKDHERLTLLGSSGWGELLRVHADVMHTRPLWRIPAREHLVADELRHRQKQCTLRLQAPTPSDVQPTAQPT